MKANLIVVSIIGLILLSCSSYIAKYYFEPIDRNNIQPDLYGRYTYSLDTEKLKFRIDPDADRVGFRLFNNSKDSIYIVWNEIKVLNRTDRIEIKNFKPSKREDAFIDTVNQKVYSLTLVTPDTNYVEELTLDNFIPYQGKNEIELGHIAKKKIGTEILIVIPLMINSVINEYKFPFDVVTYDIRRK